MNDIDPNVYLTQTDTVIGFISQDQARLNEIKGRTSGKRYITALPSLQALKERTRIPLAHHNLVRRSRRTTFILPDNNSYRVIRDKHHLKLLKSLGWAYTTSANRSHSPYDENWARSVADVVVEPLQHNTYSPSAIYKIGKKISKRIR